jgi:cysteine-rich repeat protein
MTAAARHARSRLASLALKIRPGKAPARWSAETALRLERRPATTANSGPNDGCSETCTIETGFTCTEDTAGKSSCTAGCGDGTKAGEEACDDGNSGPNDGCSETCTIETGFTCTEDTAGKSSCTVVCGDGTKAGEEACDDGNSGPNDGCSETCTIETGFTCTEDTAGKSSCTVVCGDGTKAGEEACDDGNSGPNDGCSETCTIETGFTCTEDTAGKSSCTQTRLRLLPVRGASAARKGGCGRHRVLSRAVSPAMRGNAGVIVQGPYQGRLECEWIVQAAATDASSDVSILFERFDIGSEDDVVTVFECTDASCAAAEKVASYSSFKPPFSLSSRRGHGFKVALKSKGRDLRRGFLATYCTAASAPCAPWSSSPAPAPGTAREGKSALQASAWTRRESMIWVPSEEVSSTRLLSARSAVSAGSWGVRQDRTRLNRRQDAGSVRRIGNLNGFPARRSSSPTGSPPAGPGGGKSQTARDAYLAMVNIKLSQAKERVAVRAQEFVEQMRARATLALRRDHGMTQDGGATPTQHRLAEAPAAPAAGGNEAANAGNATTGNETTRAVGQDQMISVLDELLLAGTHENENENVPSHENQIENVRRPAEAPPQEQPPPYLAPPKEQQPPPQQNQVRSSQRLPSSSVQTLRDQEYGGGGYYSDGYYGSSGYSDGYYDYRKAGCTDVPGYTDDYGRVCEYYDYYPWECSWNYWMSSQPTEACCACGGGKKCATIIGGVNNECGCQNQCTNSIDLTASGEQTITSSLDKTENYFTGVGWRKLYQVSGCFWVIKTHGDLGILAVNITEMPDGHYLEVSFCDGIECCFPILMGETAEGMEQLIRLSNPPQFMRLELKTRGWEVPDDQRLEVRIASFSVSNPPDTVCGDGVPDPGGSEECDDTNTANGDGCSSTCRIEDGWDCKGDLNSVADMPLPGSVEVVRIRTGPMSCRKMCKTDNPCQDCAEFDAGYGVTGCDHYKKGGFLHEYCKADTDEFGIYAFQACPVACATSFILQCDSNRNTTIAFGTLETRTEMPAGFTEIEPDAFPDGSALKAVRHKFPSSTDRSAQGYTLQSLSEVWNNDPVATGEMEAPPVPSDVKRNAGIENAVLNHDIVGQTALRINNQLQQLTARVTMAVDPCRLRTAGGCRNVSGRTLELCGPGQAALFSYVNGIWSYDGSPSAHVDPERLTNITGNVGKFNASAYLLDPNRKALDAAGSSSAARSPPSPPPTQPPYLFFH